MVQSGKFNINVKVVEQNLISHYRKSRLYFILYISPILSDNDSYGFVEIRLRIIGMMMSQAFTNVSASCQKQNNIHMYLPCAFRGYFS